ncbi:13388_t:CDS:2, partial [Dentiscutata erythropus]
MDTCKLEKFYQKEDQDHDVIIFVGDPPNVISFSLHSEVLKRRSKYFQVALSSEWVRKQDGAPTDGKSCLNRTVAADELSLTQLSLHEQNFLITNRSEWIRNNFILVYKIIITLPTLELLCDFCLKMLCQEPSLLLNYKTIHLVDEKTLSVLLKMDALQMDEISIWKTVVQWGITKVPYLSESNIEDWTQDDWELLKSNGDREKAKVARPKRIKNKCFNNKRGSFMMTAKNHFTSPGPSLKFSRFCGPCFGKSDLQLQNRLCYCKQRDYDDNITEQSGLFEIDDYEIF